MTKLEGQEKYTEVKENQDLVGLLKLVQAICCNFEAKTKPYWALMGAKTCFALFWQDINTSIDKYRDDSEAHVETVESYRGTLGYENRHIKKEVKKIGKMLR